MENFKRADIVEINLDNGQLYRSFANKQIGEGDQAGNVFGGMLTRNGQPVDISGALVTGYFIRSDGACIIINGTASGNTFTVTLPAQCYAIEGNFSLAINVTGAGSTETMRIIDGTVVNTATGIVIDPGSIVPSLEQLLAVIEQAEAAAEEIAGFVITEELISGDDFRLIVSVTE